MTLQAGWLRYATLKKIANNWKKKTSLPANRSECGILYRTFKSDVRFFIKQDDFWSNEVAAAGRKILFCFLLQECHFKKDSFSDYFVLLDPLWRRIAPVAKRKMCLFSFSLRQLHSRGTCIPYFITPQLLVPTFKGTQVFFLLFFLFYGRAVRSSSRNKTRAARPKCTLTKSCHKTTSRKQLDGRSRRRPLYTLQDADNPSDDDQS